MAGNRSPLKFISRAFHFFFLFLVVQMADEDDFTGMTISQRLEHKKWQARVHGYQELAKKFAEAEEDTAAVFRDNGRILLEIDVGSKLLMEF